ncbi:UDP-glucose/GDP-mannose dehydrogenase family protein [Candidatus Microgenomates bacterium]|nr:UDP-glucose/GDP-mannose dehydrogenase family protein [Candidatus Microgenomates bacterium]
MKVGVVGTGYVGLVTGTCLAETGNHVTCVDIDETKVSQLKRGAIPIYEPHLEGLFQRNIKEGRLKFTTQLAPVAEAEIIFLALPTPSDGDGAADLTHVLEVVRNLASLLKRHTVVVNKSTVPVGTAERVRTEIAKRTNVEFDVISNPEFLREGFAVDDFMKPDRIIIGSSSERATGLMRQLFMPFVRQGNPILVMDERSAELTKYTANTYLATKISFMNEVANLAERVGANVDNVRLGIGADERIGKRFLFAGIGYGGSCFPKDVKALRQIAKASKYDFRILDSVMAVNEHQKTTLIKKIKRYFKHDLKGKTFALWGLAFKPDTDDIREAPALRIIEQLLKAGAEVQAFDPQAMANVKASLKDRKLRLCHDPYEAVKNAEALIIATEWAVFRTPDFDQLAKLLKQPVIFDGRNLYDPKDLQAMGFYYASIGRATVDGRN